MYMVSSLALFYPYPSVKTINVNSWRALPTVERQESRIRRSVLTRKWNFLSYTRQTGCNWISPNYFRKAIRGINCIYPPPQIVPFCPKDLSCTMTGIININGSNVACSFLSFFWERGSVFFHYFVLDVYIKMSFNIKVIAIRPIL